jgi:4-amino-4-deoxy-L-arabinose transferase-like glycosyltransferase
MPSRAFATAGIGVFLFSALLIFLLTADLFIPSLDEGIYLEGAHRLLLGQAPYRDFFAYTGPLIYWVQAALERIFGPDMRMLRLSTAFSVGLLCFGTYWMAERFVGWKTAVAAALVFLGMLMPSFQAFIVNHRWLSTAFITLAIAAALDAARNDRARRLWFAAGALGAAAAWATPSFLIPLGVLAVWTLARREVGIAPPVFLTAGALLVSLPPVLWLARQGALVPMLDKLVWVSRQYSQANRVPFGYYPFAFRATREAVGAINRVHAFLGDARFVIPVVLIPVALILGALEIARRRWNGPRSLLVWLALGTLLTTWPRWDVVHLAGVMPPFYVILAIWAEERMRSTLSKPVHLAVLAGYAIAVTLAFTYAVQLLSTVSSYNYFPTRLGLLRNIEEDGDAYAALEQRIPEGESMFVFPYMPSIGYALKTTNPSSYSYLQPGMMSHADEAAVLGELQLKPPRFILRQYLPEDDIIEVWPNSDRSEMRFPTIEDFIANRYTAVDKVRSPHFELTVLERRTQ